MAASRVVRGWVKLGRWVDVRWERALPAGGRRSLASEMWWMALCVVHSRFVLEVVLRFSPGAFPMPDFADPRGRWV
ncbi:MAG: hypothetical protein ABW167_19495 [Baekduia sp.]